jgi:hypothetical protein
LGSKKEHRNYYVQWAGQFYVAAELSKRDFLVSLTLGNARETDLMVKSPNGVDFRVEVKTQRKRNFWRYSEKQVKENLFHVFVYLNEIGQNPDFHILTSQEAMSEWNEYYCTHLKDGRKRTDYGLGTNPASIDKYKNKWEKLPE